MKQPKVTVTIIRDPVMNARQRQMILDLMAQPLPEKKPKAEAKAS